MTRVLMVSKFKKFQGGVERHIKDLISGLEERGHKVMMFSSEDVEAGGGSVFSASATGLTKIKAGKVLLWNSKARALLRSAIDEFEPDIIHYHSIYHQLSPSTLGAFGVPAVMTLHDYKLAAPCYTLYRDGEVCQACVGKPIAIPAIRYQCVSTSTTASALCALESVVHKHRYRSCIGRFIVPSGFAYDIAVRGGLPPERVSIIPWGTSSAPRAASHASNVAFFGGRLHRTKGLHVLLEAWDSLPPNHAGLLRIAGEGELEPLVKNAASANSTIQFLGMLSSESVINEVEAAAVALVPSLFPETMGLSALEALVAGTPVVSSGRGALADLGGPGVWTLPNVDVPSVRSALVELLLNGLAEAYRRDLRSRDLSLYRFERMIDSIEAEYRLATDESLLP